MNKSKISNLDIGILATYLFKSFIIINGINILLNIGKSDSIISLIIGFIIGFLFIYLFNKISLENIFDSLNKKFSKTISIMIKILLISSVITFTSFQLYYISMFIKSSLLNTVDILPISILFLITILYLTNKGITAIIRTSFICFFVFIILELTTLFLIFPNINSLKILPLFSTNPLDITGNSIIYIILSIFPLFLLLSIPKKYIDTSKKRKKYIKIFYIISNLYLIFNFILVLSIIDVQLASMIEYPELFILSKISILNFFDRMEAFLCFKLIFDSFFTITMSIFYIYEALNSFKITKLNNKYIRFIVPILILFISNYFEYSNTYLIISLIIFGILNILIALKPNNT